MRQIGKGGTMLPARDLEMGWFPISRIRLSLCSHCNLQCAGCHNDGQDKPWIAPATNARLGDIAALVPEIRRRSKKAIVRVTGGEPMDHPQIFDVWDLINKSKDNTILWRLTTNGTALLVNRNGCYDRLMKTGPFDMITISIDSMGNNARPSSSVSAPSGEELMQLAVRLGDEYSRRHFWGQTHRAVNINIVYMGKDDETLAVADAARKHDLPFTIIQLVSVLGSRPKLNEKWERLKEQIHEKVRHVGFNTTNHLNEQDWWTAGAVRAARTYPDHCKGEEKPDCATCRILDFRFVPTREGLAAVPCYQQTHKNILVVQDGVVIQKALDHAIEVNGTGPDWA